MDVTSLLNGNAAAGQQKVEDQAEKMEIQRKPSTSPPRNRTPWDAGGYSLPINTVSNQSISAAQSGQSGDLNSNEDIPHSPKHKFSDSRSSLSSFTSSQHSAGHSRFSSMSTVGSSHPAAVDKVSGESRRGTPQPQSLGSPIDNSVIEPRLRSSLSPTGSLDALAVAAERRQSREEQLSPMQQTTEAMEATNITPTKERAHGRPGSPSDAILIKRASVPSLRLNTEELVDSADKQTSMYLSAPLEHQGHPTYNGGHRHKRAVSAPDFPPTVITEFAARRGSSVMIGGHAEPTPPPSHHPDHHSPPAPIRYNAPDTPPTTTAEMENQQVICMYIPNCDTGSQPRKAISHIFGRNKMCTRLIPQQVWVHYCRKHYQRSRYRNPKEYAKLQCDLVQQQIRRVHAWSEENRQRGEAGVVENWGLAVRKREQKRLDDLGGANRKRRASAFDRNDSDEGDNGDDARGNPVPATAVPQWLLEQCQKGYSTEEILHIFSRLHREILEDSMPCFPDIEILPNIVVDQEEEPKADAKGFSKRKPFANAHKRSQSLGVAMKPGQFYQQPMVGRRMSQPVVWQPQDMYANSPIQKRRRATEEDYAEQQMPPFQRQRMMERPVEAGRRLQGLVHRPVFANIEEHQVDENDYREVQGRGSYFTHSPSPAYRAPLPAPTPQRLHNPSMAAHLETTNEPARRPMHQRSQSDMGFSQRGQVAYGQPTSVYTQSPAYQPHAAPVQQRHEQPGGYSPYAQPQQVVPRYHEAPVRQHPYADPRQLRPMSGPGHARHQSTPMMIPQHVHQAQPMAYGREAPPPHPSYAYSQGHAGNLPPPRMENQHPQGVYATARR
ncbi:hypothetical protein BP5796_02449 [Coleophoma crateriformis]|uniref:ORP1 n=1 Tax=Coleophoma crateriformis TaxID=565419 RepID=A0A3D8SYD7_9HELO|nr:hypothetical protein BP5796_02449 [Coleophoma crateriformis]